MSSALQLSGLLDLWLPDCPLDPSLNLTRSLLTSSIRWSPWWLVFQPLIEVCLLSEYAMGTFSPGTSKWSYNLLGPLPVLHRPSSRFPLTTDVFRGNKGQLKLWVSVIKVRQTNTSFPLGRLPTSLSLKFLERAENFLIWFSYIRHAFRRRWGKVAHFGRVLP